jgi:hypothetical protein
VQERADARRRADAEWTRELHAEVRCNATPSARTHWHAHAHTRPHAGRRLACLYVCRSVAEQTKMVLVSCKPRCAADAHRARAHCGTLARTARHCVRVLISRAHTHGTANSHTRNRTQYDEEAGDAGEGGQERPEGDDSERKGGVSCVWAVRPAGLRSVHANARTRIHTSTHTHRSHAPMQTQPPSVPCSR